MFDFKHSGGQVMPIPHRANKTTGIDEEMPHTPGMSLRDYFAGQALAGLLGNEALNGQIASRAKEHEIDQTDIVAIHAYFIADAMLAHREKPVKGEG